MARKIVTKFEIVLLVIIGFIILTFTLKKCGLDVTKETEETEIIDRPHQ